MEEKIKRVFLGELNPYTEKNKMKRNFHTKHLRAYLKGQERFTFGRDEETKPQYYDVQYKEYKVKDD